MLRENGVLLLLLVGGQSVQGLIVQTSAEPLLPS